MGFILGLILSTESPIWTLHKASKLHVTLKTAFLLAVATAKRCSEIHALAMDSKHLRFNQSDGSVSLIVQIGFLAKTQLPSITQILFLSLIYLIYAKGNIRIDFYAR